MEFTRVLILIFDLESLGLKWDISFALLTTTPLCCLPILDQIFYCIACISVPYRRHDLWLLQKLLIPNYTYLRMLYAVLLFNCAYLICYFVS